MDFLVSLVGLGVAGVGLFGSVSPRHLIGLLTRWRVLTGLPLVIAMRLGTGALFVMASASCRWPRFVRLVGVAEIVAAGALIAIGDARLHAFVRWWLERPMEFVRYWCLAAVGFGILIAYAGAG